MQLIPYSETITLIRYCSLSAYSSSHASIHSKTLILGPRIRHNFNPNDDVEMVKRRKKIKIGDTISSRYIKMVLIHRILLWSFYCIRS